MRDLCVRGESAPGRGRSIRPHLGSLPGEAVQRSFGFRRHFHALRNARGLSDNPLDDFNEMIYTTVISFCQGE